MKQNYVTAFSGRRDSYQVPLSLFENGRLGKFVTDGYDAGAMAGVLNRLGVKALARRKCADLPNDSVDAHFRHEFAGRLLRRVMQPSRSGVIADAWTARAGAAVANERGASALFYEFQAELGFSLLKSPSQRRMLFHFHPHPGWEHPLLAADARRYPAFAELVASSTRANLPRRYAEHTCSAWRAADHIIVASSCTRTSLLHVGCPDEKITIVPYGCETVEAAKPLANEPEEHRPYFLWVGAGSHRKGLHHLCRAWEIAGCATEATLIVVARVIDPGMEPLLKIPGIRWVQGLPRAELNWYFSHARAFVMPSLSEGFGQVYLEALAKGCPVIGTLNSVLPDIVAAQPWIDYVEPGNVEDLAERLKTSLHRSAGMNEREKVAVADSVRKFTWEGFRSGIESVLQRFD
jgi:glycosyltransferase involved in cell wall biosynthesis